MEELIEEQSLIEVVAHEGKWLALYVVVTAVIAFGMTLGVVYLSTRWQTEEDEKKKTKKGKQQSKSIVSKPRDDGLLQTLWARANEDITVLTKFNITITTRLIGCLRPGYWLNDEIINFYLCMLNARGHTCTCAPDDYLADPASRGLTTDARTPLHQHGQHGHSHAPGEACNHGDGGFGLRTPADVRGRTVAAAAPARAGGSSFLSSSGAPWADGQNQQIGHPADHPHRHEVHKCYCFNTFFFTKLCKPIPGAGAGAAAGDAGAGLDQPSAHSAQKYTYNYEAVKRWCQKAGVNILMFEKLLVPLHIRDSHWALLVVNMVNKQIEVYDSLLTRPSASQLPAPQPYREEVHYLLQFLEDEVTNSYGDSAPRDFNARDFRMKIMWDTPKQDNSCDCGVFMLLYATAITESGAMSFRQQNIPQWRDRITRYICSGQLPCYVMK